MVSPWTRSVNIEPPDNNRHTDPQRLERGAGNKRSPTKILFGIWLVVQVLAIVYATQTTPTGDGFTRGLNRVVGVMGFQGLAGVVALLLAYQSFQSRALLPRIWRILATVPLIIASLLLLSVVGLIFWAQFN